MIQGFRKLRRREQASVVFALVVGGVVAVGATIWITVWVVRGAVKTLR